MRLSLQAWLRENRSIAAIMAITVAVFIVDSLTGLSLTQWGAKSHRIWAGELHRLLIPTLLHHGILHLAVNMYALYVFGPVTERILGPKRFVVLYILSGAVGFLASLLASPGTLAVGASASIFGLMGYTLHFRLRRLPRRWLPIDSGFLQIFLINFLFAQMVPNIDHWGHVGGFVGGLLCGGLLGLGRPVVRSPRRIRESATAALVLAVLLFVGVRPLDTTYLVQGLAPGLAGSMQGRYGRYFMPFVATHAGLHWRYSDGDQKWERLGDRINGNRHVELALIWRWERGARHEPGQSMPYEIVWKRNGQVFTASREVIQVPGFYIHTIPPMLGSALAGEWSVEIIGQGRSLVEVRAVVPATR